MRSPVVLLTLLWGCGRINFADVVAEDDLVARFEMDDDGDTIRDSKNGLDGACLPGPCPARVAGVFDRAISCDGTNAFVVPFDPRLTLASEFTVSLWVARTGGTTAISKPQRFGVGATYELIAGANGFCTDPDPGPDGEDCMFATMSSGPEWVHYAMVWDGTEKILYLDGIEAARAAAVTVFDDREVVICADAEDGPSPTTPLVGAIDEVRIYRRALTATEIVSLATPPNLN
jgi:hypothetical protein